MSRRYLLLATVIVVLEAVLYLHGWTHLPEDGAPWESIEGTPPRNVTVVLGEPSPGSPAGAAGIRAGDRLVAINGRPLEVHQLTSSFEDETAGTTVVYDIRRNGQRLLVPVTLDSRWTNDWPFYVFYYILIAISAGTGIYVLAKRPHDFSTRLFFLFTQVYAICLNSKMAVAGELGTIRTAIFVFVFPFLGVVLTHFMLRFPVRSRIHERFPALPRLLYALTLIFSLFLVVSLLRFDFIRTPESEVLFFTAVRAGLMWMGATLLAAFVAGMHQFATVKEVLAHNQMRWVMVGLVLGLLPEALFGLSPDLLWRIEQELPLIAETIWAFGTVILLGSLSFAILRYRLWDIELILRRSLLYAGVTFTVAAAYLGVLSISELAFDAPTPAIRVAAVMLAAFVFIPVRERLQGGIDRLFHREGYDAAEIVIEFDRPTAAVSDPGELYRSIVERIDGVLHFESFGMYLVEHSRSYRLAAGVRAGRLPEVVVASDDFEARLGRDRPFAVRELGPEGFFGAEIIIPITLHERVEGFFACGRKQSERVYTHEDVQLLRLLAGRTAGLLHLAELYRREMERQALLEQERTRIAKDMHDDVGASLTKIAILGELAMRDLDPTERSTAFVRDISSTAREVVDEIGEIIWALNPRNDTLDNLIAYARSHLADFFDNTEIECRFEVADEVPPIHLSSETRRNLLLVLKEAAHNIVKHSGARHAAVRFRVEGARFEAVVEDDGRGFDPAVASAGNGLINMRRRIEDIGGEFRLESTPQSGTRLRAVVDLSSSPRATAR